MDDKLVIEGLGTECRIGVTEAERATPQKIQLDLELAIDAAKAAAHDDVRDALDYAALVSTVTQHVQRKPYHLLETLAEDVASHILSKFPTTNVRVRIKKRALPSIEYAAVEVVRKK